jgi:signal transduction histidine kinase
MELDKKTGMQTMGRTTKIRWQLLSTLLPVTIIPFLLLVLLVSNGFYRYIVIQSDNFYSDMLGQISRSIDSMYTRYAGIMSEIVESPGVRDNLSGPPFRSEVDELAKKKEILDGFQQIENMKVDGRVYIIDRDTPSLIDDTDYSLYYNFNYPLEIDIPTLLSAPVVYALQEERELRMIMAGYSEPDLERLPAAERMKSDQQETVILFPYYTEENRASRESFSEMICILLKPFHLRGLYRDLEKLKPGTLFILDRFDRIISSNHPSPDDTFPYDYDTGAYTWETGVEGQTLAAFNDYRLLVTDRAVLRQPAVEKIIDDVRAGYYSVFTQSDQRSGTVRQIISMHRHVSLIRYERIRYLAVVEYSPAAQVTLAYFYPVELVLRPIRLLLILIYLLSLLMIALSAIFIVFFSGRLTRPIIALSEEADRISGGIFKGSPVDITANNEVGILVEAFNRMIHEITDYAENLEHKVTERTLELEKATSDRTRFFINLAHETKTPLTLIKNYMDDYMAGAPADARLDTISASIDKLVSDMVNFLDIQKLERGDSLYDHAQVVSMASLLDSQSKLFKHAADRRDLAITFNVTGACNVTADPFALERIINNLLSNAIKYTGRHGTVDVTLLEDDRTVRLVVTDTGAGIEESRLKTIFLPFYRITHEKRSLDGMGIGLSIVERIVTNLGGTITVASEPGRGSEFTVELPLAREDEPVSIFEGSVRSLAAIGTADGIRLSEDVNPKTPSHDIPVLLLVEDNRDLMTLLANKLSTSYQVYTAGSGNEALTRLESMRRPDAIISDMMMDDMDGRRLLAILQDDRRYRDVPFIFITAHTDSEARIEALHDGAIDYIYKPFSFPELESKIDALLRFNAMKRKMFEQEKFATIGMMVSGIAHQVFNPVTGISASVENLEKRLSERDSLDESTREHFSYLYDNINRVIDIVNSLKLLYYKREIPTDDVNIFRAVSSVLTIIGSRVPPGVEIITDINPECTLTASYPVLIQVVMNLVTNALDAVHDGDTITISTIRETDRIFITVADTGAGVDPGDLPHIFDAFFTTRAPGAGTGLGLYIVKDLVVSMGWDITVESEHGRGTTFTVIVPVSTKGENSD